MMSRSYFVFVSLALAFVGAPLGAGEKSPLALDDIYRQESISDFQVSPRGDEAVYVRHWYDVNEPGRRTSLWRVDGATGRHEPLEPGEPDGRMPVYSPDGDRLAFVSLRDFQGAIPFVPVAPYSDPTGAVWMLPRSKYAARIAELQTGKFFGGQVLTDGFYGRLAFSRQGDQFLAVAGFDRLNGHRPRSSLATVDVANEDQGEGYEGYYTALVWRSGPEGGHGPFVRDDSRLRYWYGDAQWTPDAEHIICHANRSEHQESVRYSINKNYDLWRFPRYAASATETVERLTHNSGPDVSPRISPDGKHVLYLSVPRQGPHMDVFNLCVLPLDEKDAEPRIVIDAHNAEPDDDGTPPFQPTFPLRDDSWIDDKHVRVRGVRGMKSETLVFNIAGEDAPIDAGATPKPTPPKNDKLNPPSVNEWLADRYRAREEIVRWKSFDGLEIEGILTTPPEELKQFQRPYPVIVYPHGGPHSASKPGFNFTVHLFAAHGYAVFQPNFRGTYGYGRKFLDAARFDMGGSDMQDILTGVDMLIERGDVDAKRQFVYGISYGGYSTCRLITLTNRFKAACAQNAVTDLHAMWRLSDLQSWTEWEFGGKPWETVEHEGRKIDVGALMRERSPTTDAHKVKTPTLILHSDHDRRCPLAMGQMFYRILKESGCETELVVYKDERHGMWQVKHQADVLRRVLDWFGRHDAK